MAANYPNEMSMDIDATCNFPPQVMSSSSLLHLGNGFFCFVLSGMSPHPEESNYQYVVEDKGKRVLSTLGQTYKKCDEELDLTYHANTLSCVLRFNNTSTNSVDALLDYGSTNYAFECSFPDIWFIFTCD